MHIAESFRSGIHSVFDGYVTYEKADLCFKRRKKKDGNSVKIGHNTWLIDNSDRGSISNYSIKLHNTVILIFYTNGEIRINTGGWDTQLTKSRISIYIPAAIYTNKDVKYLHIYSSDNTYVYEDGLIIQHTSGNYGPLTGDARILKHVEKGAAVVNLQFLKSDELFKREILKRGKGLKQYSTIRGLLQKREITDEAFLYKVVRSTDQTDVLDILPRKAENQELIKTTLVKYIKLGRRSDLILKLLSKTKKDEDFLKKVLVYVLKEVDKPNYYAGLLLVLVNNIKDIEFLKKVFMRFGNVLANCEDFSNYVFSGQVRCLHNFGDALLLKLFDKDRINVLPYVFDYKMAKKLIEDYASGTPFLYSGAAIDNKIKSLNSILPDSDREDFEKFLMVVSEKYPEIDVLPYIKDGDNQETILKHEIVKEGGVTWRIIQRLNDLGSDVSDKFLLDLFKQQAERRPINILESIKDEENIEWLMKYYIEHELFPNTVIENFGRISPAFANDLIVNPKITEDMSASLIPFIDDPDLLKDIYNDTNRSEEERYAAAKRYLRTADDIDMLKDIALNDPHRRELVLQNPNLQEKDPEFVEKMNKRTKWGDKHNQESLKDKGDEKLISHKKQILRLLLTLAV